MMRLTNGSSGPVALPHDPAEEECAYRELETACRKILGALSPEDRKTPSSFYTLLRRRKDRDLLAAYNSGIQGDPAGKKDGTAMKRKPAFSRQRHFRRIRRSITCAVLEIHARSAAYRALLAEYRQGIATDSCRQAAEPLRTPLSPVRARFGQERLWAESEKPDVSAAHQGL